jgi:hypothetical protein
MIAATSRPARAASSAAGSFHGTTTVSAACAAVTPGLAGMPCVARPEPDWARRPSTCPWYAPANFSTASRPVAARATRIALMLASVPEEVIRTISAAGTRSTTAAASSDSASVGAP